MSCALALPALPLACGSNGADDGRRQDQNGGAAADAGRGGAGEDATNAGAGAGASANGGAISIEAGAGGTAGTGPSVTVREDFDVQYQLASDVDPNAPGTIGIVTWSLDEPSIDRAEIQFGLEEDAYDMSAPVDLDEPDYRTLLLGMKPEKTYHFRVLAESEGVTYASESYSIETGPATTLVPPMQVEVMNEAARERGFIVTSFWSQSAAVAIIIDADGDIVWWYDAGTEGVSAARMSADGKNIWMVGPDANSGNSGSPLIRVSMDTLDVETYPETRGSHDITPVSGGLMAYIDYGERDCSSIFEIDPAGEATEVFESTDHVGVEECHGNAVRYSAAEDIYTFSDRRDDILGVSRDGEVLWRFSERIAGGNATWGGSTHGHHLLDDSFVLFANNGGVNARTGAVFEFTLAGEELKRYDAEIREPVCGDVQRLPQGNTLMTYATHSRIQEVDANWEPVLEIYAGGGWPCYSAWRETLYGPPPEISQ